MCGLFRMSERTLATAERLLEWFSGRLDYVAFDDGSGFKPLPLKQPLSAEKLLTAHMSGDVCLGFYPLREDSTVMCSCLDFDNHDGSYTMAKSDACKSFMQLLDLGFSPVLEESQSGTGMHVWLFFSEPVPAKHVVAFWREFKRRVDLPSGLEHYPRQSSLEGLTLGNLIRYPLFKQSRLVLFTHNNEQTGECGFVEQDPITLLAEPRTKKVTPDELIKNLQWWDLDPEESDETVDVLTDGELSPRVRSMLLGNASGLLARRWAGDVTGLSDPSNSGVVMSVATELVRAYVPTPEVEQAIRYWSQAHGYEKGIRSDFIRRTLNKAYDMVVDRKERQSLSGDTFAGLAHKYAEMVLNNEVIVIPTGITGLDASFGGGGLAELTIISARPNNGKTALAMNWADNAALLGFPSLLISLEMSAEESSRRVLLNLGNMAPDRWKTLDGNTKLHQRIDEHYSKRAPMYFTEGPFHIEQIHSTIDRYVQDHGVKMVVVDYIGLADAGKRDEKDNVSAVVKALKQCAKRNKIHVLALVQMTRTFDAEDRAPRMSDLRGSGEIENTADLILFGHWFWKSDTTAPKNAYAVYAVKARNRAINTPEMLINFDPDTQRFF